MSRNGSGTYSLPAGNPVVTGTTISSTWANNTLTDIATALTGSLAADGQTTATGNLKMGNNRVTGLADGLASTDAATVSQATSAVAITGGTINGTSVGATTASTGRFTTLDSTGNTTVGGTLAVTGNGSFNSTGAVKVPVGTTAQQPTPVTGMIRFNSTTSLYEGYGTTAWGALGGGATGGGSDQIFNLNGQTVTTSYSIPSGKNASSAGPITIDTAATVTIPTGSVWVIV
jgi:hypothetical protein